MFKNTLGSIPSFLLALFFILNPHLQQLSAQPSNDSCAMAKVIALPLAFGDPLSYPGHNIGATPEIPASNSSNCTPGGIFSGLGADVWYTFTPDRAMCVRVEVNGLQEPEFSVREGSFCTQTAGVACVAGTGGTVSEVVSLRANQTYFLRVSGANYNDQDYFNLSFTRVGCPFTDDPCLILDHLTVSPEPSIAMIS